MCIAIFQNAGNIISDDEFYNCWCANPDGGGFAYITPTGEIKVQHYMKYKKMYAAYRAAMEVHGDTSPFLVHFRIATHGSVDLSNCHPFKVNDNQVLIHNGMIPVLYDKGERRSDTRIFAEDYMRKMPDGWLDDPFMVDMVEDFITTGSKVAFLSTNTEHAGYILNQKLGHWTDGNGIWWSNSSYKTCRTTATNPQSAWYRPSDVKFEDPDIADINKCVFCDERSVYDGVCYECETCQGCCEPYEYCTCPGSSIHSMTDHQYYNMSGLDDAAVQQQIPF